MGRGGRTGRSRRERGREGAHFWLSLRKQSTARISLRLLRRCRLSKRTPAKEQGERKKCEKTTTPTDTTTTQQDTPLRIGILSLYLRALDKDPPASFVPLPLAEVAPQTRIVEEAVDGGVGDIPPGNVLGCDVQ